MHLLLLLFVTKSYDILSISEDSPSIPDEEVLSIANSQNRILLTSDKDFGELVFRLKLLSSGIILLRVPQLTNEEKAILTLSCINQFSDKLQSSFCVIAPNKIRIVSL